MSPASRHGHFTPEFFRFVRDLERHNHREWFERNRERYIRHARAPMLLFIEHFGPRLRRISPQLVADPAPHGGSMFRIHRDTRFSKDKRPYKTAVTARFPHVGGKDVHTPGYYIHLGADGVYAGAGLWHPDRVSLAKVRRAILENPGAWKRCVSGPAFRRGLELWGETLARPPRGFDPHHPLIEDLKRKDFVAMAELDERAACAPDFLDRYTRICRTAAPLVRFLTEAVGLRWS